jgi:hypothetical protein
VYGKKTVKISAISAGFTDGAGVSQASLLIFLVLSSRLKRSAQDAFIPLTGRKYIVTDTELSFDEQVDTIPHEVIYV